MQSDLYSAHAGDVDCRGMTVLEEGPLSTIKDHPELNI